MRNYLIRFKGTLIAFLIFLILLASVFLINREEAADVSTKDVTTGEVFPDIAPEEVTSIKLMDKSSRFSLVKGDNGVWMVVTNSGEYKADNELVDNLIKALTEMKKESSIEERMDKLDQYGFVDSRTEFSISTERANYPVIVGDKSPVGSGTYIYDLGEGRVMIVDDGYLEGVVDKNANYYRDKHIFNINRGEVDRITLSVGDFSVELKKENGEWTIAGSAGPKAADSGVITTLLDSYSGIKVSDFVSDGPVDLEDYGFTDPVAEIGFYSGEEGEEFLFGNRKNESDFYLKVAQREPIYSVSKNYFKILPKNMGQLVGK